MIATAMRECGRKEVNSLVDHLLLHTPEEQLPQRFRATRGGGRGGATMMTMRTRQSLQANLSSPSASASSSAASQVTVVKHLRPQEEKVVRELMFLGFDREAASDACLRSRADPQKALLLLLARLQPAARPDKRARGEEEEEEELEAQRFEERIVMESIYGEENVREIWFEAGRVVGLE
eukprot:387259-Hanusia_phi.AAC.1